jgi:hypothetical protein
VFREGVHVGLELVALRTSTDSSRSPVDSVRCSSFCRSASTAWGGRRRAGACQSPPSRPPHLHNVRSDHCAPPFALLLTCYSTVYSTHGYVTL